MDVPTLLLTLDVEEFVIPEEAGIPFDVDEAFALGHEGLERVAAVLARHDVPVTHFVTAEFARRFAPTLTALHEAGHELALHAVEHRHDYRAMAPEDATRLLREGRDEISGLCGAPIRGYRANRFRAPSADVLKALDVAWTSNLHPTWVPGEYDHRGEPRGVHERDGIPEIPISVTPRLRLPGSWFWMRNFGPRYTRYVARRACRETGFLNLYLHPWEFAELPRLSGLSALGRLSVRGTGDRFARRLEDFIVWARNAGFAPGTVSPFLARHGWIPS